MNLETLRLFCDVVRCRSFSRGAAMNGITQSAASQAVSQLERDLGTRLIDRSKRPFILTAQGEIYYEGLCDVLHRFDGIEARARALRQDMAGSVRVAAIYSVGLHNMGLCMQKFMSQYPKAKVRLEYLRPNKVYEAVLNQDVDMGIVSYPTASRELAVIPLRTEKMMLVCRPDHYLACNKTITARQLHGENFVSFDWDLVIRKELDRFLARNRVVVRVVMEFDNIETIKRSVEIGAGISVVPQLSVRREVQAGTLVELQFTRRNFLRPLGIIIKHSHALSPAAEKFIHLLQHPQHERPAGVARRS